MALALAVGVGLVAGSCASPLVGRQALGGDDPQRAESDAPSARDCGTPRGDVPFATADPTEVGMDTEALTRAVAYASARGAQSLRVYRHGCLVATSGNDPSVEWIPMAGWSMTKGVVSMVVGRAVALGHLSVDDPIGEHLGGLDAAHAAITVRHLLTQTSGLRMAWVNDLWAAGNADSAMLTLQRPFEAQPGTTFLYAQTTLTALVAVVEAAVGEEFQSFASRELFERIGITAAQWRWSRDGIGRTQGFAGLDMTPLAWARLGHLLLERGRWGDEQVITAGYVDAGAVGTDANAGYGYLWWTNRGEWHLNSGFPAYERKERRQWPALPPDAFALSGLFDQEVTVVPSLDVVVVRLGLPPETFADPLGESPGIRPKWDWRFDRLLGQSFTDVVVPDPGDWRYEGPDPPTDWHHIVEWSLPPFG